MTTWYPQTRQPNSRGFYGFGAVSLLNTPADISPESFLNANSFHLIDQANVRPLDSDLTARPLSTPTQAVAEPETRSKYFAVGAVLVAGAAFLAFKKFSKKKSRRKSRR